MTMSVIWKISPGRSLSPSHPKDATRSHSAWDDVCSPASGRAAITSRIPVKSQIYTSGREGHQFPFLLSRCVQLWRLLWSGCIITSEMTAVTNCTRLKLDNFAWKKSCVFHQIVLSFLMRCSYVSTPLISLIIGIWRFIQNFIQIYTELQSSYLYRVFHENVSSFEF